MPIINIYKNRRNFRITAGAMIFLFAATLVTPNVRAQTSPLIPVGEPFSAIRHESWRSGSAMLYGGHPAVIKGIQIFPDNPLRFNFILDPADSKLKADDLKSESLRLIKYFLASLTVPEEDLWVNLSPYEKNRIIPKALGQTEMGTDMLAQDYLLKKITASLMHPEGELGKEFWEKVYAEANGMDIPVDTLNKVWIVPEKAVVYENKDVAFVTQAKLKVMLEEDYLGGQKTETPTTQLIRSIIIPAIEREVNEGQNFASLRQIYYSLILATWFKRNLKQGLLGQVYLDHNKIDGIDIKDKDATEKIYQKYLETLKQGVYNYLKDEYDPVSQQILPKKYFSGGESLNLIGRVFHEDGKRQDVTFEDKAMSVMTELDPRQGAVSTPAAAQAPVNGNNGSPSAAVIAVQPEETKPNPEALANFAREYQEKRREKLRSFGPFITHEFKNKINPMAGWSRNVTLLEDDIQGNPAILGEWQDLTDFLEKQVEEFSFFMKNSDQNLNILEDYEIFRTRFAAQASQYLERAAGDRVLGEMEMEAQRRISELIDETEKLLEDFLSDKEKFGKHLINHLMEENLKDIAGSQRPEGQAIHVKKEFDPAARAFMMDGIKMSMVFTNLFKNAVEAMPQGGTLTVKTEIIPSSDDSSQPVFRITISDTGTGMSDEVKARLFNKFFTTKGEKGTGLGLALCKEIVEKIHHGTIYVVSEVGKGTTFTIELPYKTDAAMVAEGDLKRKKHDLNDILNSELRKIKLMNDAREADKRFVIKEEFNRSIPEFMMDGIKIAEAFVNFLKDAVDAMPHGGTLTVKTQLIPAPDTSFQPIVRITVKDTRKERMSIQDKARLFDELLAPGHSRKGLARSKQIFQAHGGEILFDSKKTGTTFTIDLPVKTDDAMMGEDQRRERLVSFGGRIVHDFGNKIQPIIFALSALHRKTLIGGSGPQITRTRWKEMSQFMHEKTREFQGIVDNASSNPQVLADCEVFRTAFFDEAQKIQTEVKAVQNNLSGEQKEDSETLLQALDSTNIFLENLLSDDLKLAKHNLQGVLEYELEKIESLNETRETDKKIVIVRNYDRSIDKFKMDDMKMAQVFKNLFENAAAAMPDGGRLTVRTQLIPGAADVSTPTVRIEISDIGTGVDLSVSKKNVEDHKGTIDVKSEVGKGRTVTIDLPYKTDDAMMGKDVIEEALEYYDGDVKRVLTALDLTQKDFYDTMRSSDIDLNGYRTRYEEIQKRRQRARALRESPPETVRTERSQEFSEIDHFHFFINWGPGRHSPKVNDILAKIDEADARKNFDEVALQITILYTAVDDPSVQTEIKKQLERIHPLVQDNDLQQRMNDLLAQPVLFNLTIRWGQGRHSPDIEFILKEIRKADEEGDLNEVARRLVDLYYIVLNFKVQKQVKDELRRIKVLMTNNAIQRRIEGILQVKEKEPFHLNIEWPVGPRSNEVARIERKIEIASQEGLFNDVGLGLIELYHAQLNSEVRQQVVVELCRVRPLVRSRAIKQQIRLISRRNERFDLNIFWGKGPKSRIILGILKEIESADISGDYRRIKAELVKLYTAVSDSPRLTRKEDIQRQIAEELKRVEALSSKFQTEEPSDDAMMAKNPVVLTDEELQRFETVSPHLDWRKAAEVPWQEVVRDPKKQPQLRDQNDRNYWANQHEVRGEFLRLLIDIKESRITTPEQLADRFAELNRVSLLGKSRKSIYQSPSVKGGPTNVPLLAGQFGLAEERNKAIFRILLENLKRFIDPSFIKVTQEDILTSISAFYNIALFGYGQHQYMFFVGNNSLFMNMVNAMLRLYDLNGIFHGELDHYHPDFIPQDFRAGLTDREIIEGFFHIFFMMVRSANPGFNLKMTTEEKRALTKTETTDEPDKAMSAVSPTAEAPGGIDLREKKWNLETQGQGVDVKWNSKDMPDAASLTGFAPVIIQIVPANLPLLLSDSESESMGEEKPQDQPIHS